MVSQRPQNGAPTPYEQRNGSADDEHRYQNARTQPPGRSWGDRQLHGRDEGQRSLGQQHSPSGGHDGDGDQQEHQQGSGGNEDKQPPGRTPSRQHRSPDRRKWLSSDDCEHHIEQRTRPLRGLEQLEQVVALDEP
jgi:hypothetical protein